MKKSALSLLLILASSMSNAAMVIDSRHSTTTRYVLAATMDHFNVLIDDSESFDSSGLYQSKFGTQISEVGDGVISFTSALNVVSQAGSLSVSRDTSAMSVAFSLDAAYDYQWSFSSATKYSYLYGYSQKFSYTLKDALGNILLSFTEANAKAGTPNATLAGQLAAGTYFLDVSTWGQTTHIDHVDFGIASSLALAPAPVPVPGGLLLFSSALVGLMVRRQRAG